MVTALSLSLYGYNTTRDRKFRFKQVQFRKYSKERLKAYTVTKLIVFPEMKIFLCSHLTSYLHEVCSTAYTVTKESLSMSITLIYLNKLYLEQIFRSIHED